MKVVPITTLDPDLKLQSRRQTTIGESVLFSGIGIHTGEEVTMKLCPAPAGTGIVFKRVDLPGHPEIPARLEYVIDTNRCTSIGVGDAVVHTIEHVLSAVAGYSIDNLIVEVDAEEPPVANGSAEAFVELIESAGIVQQEQTVPIIALSEPVYWSEGDIHVVALPHNGFKVSYTLQYPNSEVLRAQYHSVEVTPENFKREIAPCRTFSLYEEVSTLMDRGLIKGGSLANSVVIKDEVILSKEGLKFPDEMVRHKILDVIGDLSLIGYPLHAHILAVRSGHGANFAFAKELLNHITRENS